MPFDTTYTLIFDTTGDESVLLTIPGGKDTDIYITQDELPRLMNRYPQFSEQLFKYHQSYSKPESEKSNKENTNFVNFLQLIFLVAIARLVIGITRNLAGWKKAFEKNLAAKIFLLVILTFFGITATFSSLPEFGWLLLLFNTLVVFEFKHEMLFASRDANSADEPATTENSIDTVKSPLLRYDGADLNFTDVEIVHALNKRFPYYIAISTTDKERFLHRVKNFIADKIFYIHDESGFKEMPILISAAAIQLTFGFKKYLLPYFKNIHVFPEEFFRSNNMGVCFLEGNVSGNNINLSWKHFLRGYEKNTDGQNVGLHELAHALYYQAFVVGENVDDNFRDSYDEFIDHGNKVYHTEKMVAGGIYSEYAVKNFQEFWAESAEIYFERPAMLKELHPSLYETMKTLLNQDLLNENNLPVR
jgi:MtfA peptidase